MTALAALPIGGNVGSEIRSAVDSGKEVVVHERAINSNGWSGYGYIIVDPETGAGGYLIEGGGMVVFLIGGQIMGMVWLLFCFLPLLSLRR